MSISLSKRLCTAMLLAAAPALGMAPFAVADDEAADGRIVEIAPAEDEAPAEEAAPAVEAPKYWLGLQGRPIDSAALRTHLQLANDVGVLVENIVDDSPAAKAGLQRHDVIVAVDGESIGALAELQKVVGEVGDKKPIVLTVIRLAKEMKVEVTAAERPADLPAVSPLDNGLEQRLNPLGDVEGLLRQLQEQGGGAGGVRVFGPGMIPGGGGFNLDAIPGGVSVSIARQEDGPAEITVKKGDETWTFKSDDTEALEKLPEDVRPFVQQMLEGGARGGGGLGAMRFNLRDLQGALPEGFGGAAGGREALGERAAEVRQRTEEASERLLQRMEKMEERLRELQRQLEENSPAERTNREDDASKE